MGYAVKIVSELFFQRGASRGILFNQKSADVFQLVSSKALNFKQLASMFRRNQGLLEAAEAEPHLAVEAKAVVGLVKKSVKPQQAPVEKLAVEVVKAATREKAAPSLKKVRLALFANRPSRAFFMRHRMHTIFDNPAFQMHANMSNSSVRYYSTYTHSSGGANPNGGGGFNFLLQALGTSIFLGMLGALGYIMYKAHLEPRERAIMGSIIDDEDWKQQAAVHDSEKTSNGSLSNSKIALNDKLWLKKGAKGVSELIREFVIGTALHELDPDAQPETLIFFAPLESQPSRGQFFTLSEMKERSMDLQDFITQDDWQDKLSKKPMKGLDVALAKVGMMAGQQDCKYANLIITEFDSHYEVAAIDFELSGERFFSINSRVLTTNVNQLAGFVRDLHTEDSGFGEFKVGLSDDPRGAEFMEYALQHSMSEDNVMAFYRKVAETDFITPTISRLEELASRSDIISHSTVRTWAHELTAWQTAAKEYVAEHDSTYRIR